MNQAHPPIFPQPGLGPDERALPTHLYHTYELVLSLAWSNDRQRTPPITRRRLADLRGVAERTIDHHLHALRQLGFLRNEPNRSGLPLVLLPRPRAPFGDPPAEPPSAETVTADHATTPQPSAPETSAMAVVPHPATTPLAHSDAADLCSDPEATGETTADTGHSTQPHRVAAAIDLLTDCGVYPGVARRLARLEWVTPQLVAAWHAELSGRRGVRHTGALLASLLRSPKSCLPAPRIAGRSPDTPSSLAGACPSASVVGSEMDEPATPKRSGSSVQGVPWHEALDRLRESLGQQSVDLWLGRSRPLVWEDGVLVVGVSSLRALDWLSTHWSREIHQAAVWALGCPVSVRFVLRA